MNQTLPVQMSARSLLIAGISTAVVGAAVVNPVSAPAPATAKIAAALELSSITSPIEAAIKNTYNAVEPWAEYGMSWADYILGLIPVVNWFAPAVPLAYYTIEPLVRAGTYTFADVVGLDFAQIGPDIATGITTSIDNAIRYTLAWANIPLPPPLPGASVAASAASVPADTVLSEAAWIDFLTETPTAAQTRGVESAIKNTYNALEPWAAYAAAWGQYILGFIPGLWWLAPGVSFAYYTAEPLVQAGVYTFADVLGLNFAQIGPDISTGINTSINNGINYGLAWLNSLVPLPPLPPLPPFPGASVAAPTASVRAAAAVEAPEAAEPVAAEVTSAVAGDAPAAEPAPDAPAPVAEAPAAEAPAGEIAPEVEVAPEVEAPEVEAPVVAEAPAAVEAPASHDADQPSGSDAAEKSQRPARSGRG
ncbi:hypothetical protein [Mycolicibacterium sp.]|uniref:hypothetical protein n=1 Tax=Mycolicibacterium sp. TaxID=2320850 RepID=UPI0028AFFFDF|nr:hypothetical protein [Mycolicibacterium sp.]